MYLSESDQISYLANIAFLANADGALSPKAITALEEIRTAIGAKKSTYDGAVKRALSGAFFPVRLGSFTAQVSNLADMLYIAVLDNDLSEAKKQLIADFSKSINLTDDQRTALSHDAIERLKSKEFLYTCPNCGTRVSVDSRFCPKCGAELSTSNFNLDASIPSDGYVIEFCESTSAGFPGALKLAKAAQQLSTYVQNKKTWYRATWSIDAIKQTSQLAEALSGIRNKRCYRNGEEVDWDELFGFAWCAGEREKAYRPTEYCFGKEENQINPWGSKQIRLDWTEWAKWFSYGHFEKQGLLRSTHVWTFDKARIEHELLTNLHRFRFCPYLRLALIKSVLRLLPNQVEVRDNAGWKYSHSFEQAPGSIKITEIEKSGGMEFRNEYYADGVRPSGVSTLSQLLRSAFAEAGITDVTPEQILR